MDDQLPPPARSPEPGPPTSAAPGPSIPAAPAPSGPTPYTTWPTATVAQQPWGYPIVAVPAKARRSRGAIVAIWILAVLLALAVGAGAWVTLRYLEAQDRISEQQQRISEQDGEIEKQRDLIDKKETFGAAMTGLMDTVAQFDGVLMASIVPWDEYEALAERGWLNRWDFGRMSAVIQDAENATLDLQSVLSRAQDEAQTNATGTEFEAVLDRLGGGFVRSIIDETSCGDDDMILGCVSGADPFLVHFDASGHAEPYMTDELRTGIAYHEFAHVLQYTNPEATEAAAEAFGGDWETMADCFALTFLDGWKLDHRVWVSSFEYWDVSIGYGYTCTDDQKQTIRDWHAKLGVQLQTIPAA